MKSKRRDLRISRKSGAIAVSRSSRTSSKLPHAVRSATKTDVKDEEGSVDRLFEHNGSAKNSSRREADANSTKALPSVDLEFSVGAVDYKRKRVDTTEYIKKRFLYDVSEPPRRLQRRHKITQRSTAALMAVSSANLSRRKARDSAKKTAGVGVKGGRVHHGNSKHEKGITSKSKFPSNARVDQKPSKSGFQLLATKQPQDHPQSSWDFPDLFDSESPTRSVYDEARDQGYDTDPLHHGRNSVFSDTIPEHSHERNSKWPVANRLHQVKNQHPENSRESGLGNKMALAKKPDVFIAESFFSSDRSPVANPYPDDIISFCPNRISRRGLKSKQLDYDFVDECSTSSHYPVLSERQNQPPNEDLEEEELLAPELSVLAGSSCLTTPDGSLLANFPHSGSVLATAANPIGSSRRKSPVRPMQVLRTKTSISNNNSVTAFGCSMDHNSTSGNPATYCRRMMHADDNRTDTILPVPYQPAEAEQTNIDICLTGPRVNFQSASILRLTAPNMNNKATSITIRPMHDHGSRSEDKSFGSAVDDSNTLAFGAVHTPKTGRSGKAALVKSLLLAHNSTSNRHRPTILRRSSGASRTEPDEENKKPVTRTIGAFTPGSSHSRRSGKKTSSNESSGPTKLLQLITATSLASPNLTASEKLFGRRLCSHKPSLVANVTLPVVEPRYNNTVKASVTTTNSCRYAVLRGSANGKRYIVLGDNAIFDRSNITPTIPPSVATSVETLTVSSITSHSGVNSTEPLLERLSESDDQPNHSFDPEPDSSHLTTSTIPGAGPVSSVDITTMNVS